jgi:hypothetical protein
LITDYQTSTKKIGYLYKKFKDEYRLPKNFFEEITNCKYFNFYYNENERRRYLDSWRNRLCDSFTPYNTNEFKFYMQLCLENQHINDIQIEHYIDNGCFCKYCSLKRKDIYFRAKSGETKFDKIIHTEVINKVNEERKDKIIKIIKTKISSKKVFGNEKSKLVIQPLGILVIEFLLKHFSQIFEYEYTKQMEDELDVIEEVIGSVVEKCCVYTYLYTHTYTHVHTRAHTYTHVHTRTHT